jgi:ketosteroid isomerase-like protein
LKQLGMIALVLLTAGLVIAPKSDTAHELVNAEQKFCDALQQADWKAVEQIYADDLIFTNAEGGVSHKSDEVRSVRSGDLKLESIEMSDVKVQDLGGVAVVTGKLIEKGRYKTEDLGGAYRFTDVWVKRSGRWQLVAGQETLFTQAN